MGKQQKKDRVPSHRNRHDHQHNPLEEQELGGRESLNTLDINAARYGGNDVPRSPQFPQTTEFNNDGGQPGGHYVPEYFGEDPPGHDYVYTEGTGLDQARGIDLDEEDPEDFPYPTHPPTGYEEDHDGDEDTATFDYDTREAIAQSLNQRYQSQGANQPSTSTLPNYLDSYTNILPQSSYDEQREYEQSQTPRPQHLSPSYITRLGSKNQPRSDEFTIVHSTYFSFGTVFKVHWAEPRGGNTTGESEVTKDANDDPYFSGVRRFIVVKEARGHSLCVAVYTYGKRGCLKRGVHPEHHAQAYDENQPVQGLLPGEPNLGYEPIPITISPGLIYETIDTRSRINLAKLHTINHNVPVSIIGTVDPAFHTYLRTSINTLFKNQDVPRHHGSKSKGKGKDKDRKR